MKMRMCLFSAAIAALTATSLQAAVLYSTPGGSYAQNFDTLPSSPTNTSLGASPIGWIDDTSSPGANQFSILGWHLYHPTTQSEGGANGNQRMRLGTGSANTGAFWSFGSGTLPADRALGMVNANTMAAQGSSAFLGVRLTNNTGVTLNEFTVSYTGEQYRDGGSAGGTPFAQTTFFEYSVGAISIQDTGYTGVSALDFTSPTFANVASGGVLDGNVAANKTAKGPTTVTGITWLPGQDLWLRWVDLNDSNGTVIADHGLAIDDFSFSANVTIPEPASIALAAMAGLGIVALRRRK